MNNNLSACVAYIMRVDESMVPATSANDTFKNKLRLNVWLMEHKWFMHLEPWALEGHKYYQDMPHIRTDGHNCAVYINNVELFNPTNEPLKGPLKGYYVRADKKDEATDAKTMKRLKTVLCNY